MLDLLDLRRFTNIVLRFETLVLQIGDKNVYLTKNNLYCFGCIVTTPSYMRKVEFFDSGGIQQLHGQFLYPERGQKQTFFDPLPPSFCPRSY